MKTSTILSTLAVFVAAFCATMLVREDVRAPRGATARAAASAPGARDKGRSGDELLAEVRRFLRAGDLDGARAVLAEAAEKDPVGFFTALERLPQLDGMEDLTKLAAARLPWKDKEITALLNRIGAPRWRDMAWESYAGSRVGSVPDEEIMDVAGHARQYNWIAGIETLLNDAAQKRPIEFMGLLNRMGGTSIREAYMQIIMKYHPELAGEIFRSIPDGSPDANYSRSYALQARVVALPTADNLMAALKDAGDWGVSSITGTRSTAEAYIHANDEERQSIREAIAMLPPLARTRMLRGMLMPWPDKPVASVEEYSQILAISPSAVAQEQGLEAWMKLQPGIDTQDRAWIDQLPSDKLKTKANEILDSRVVEKK